MKKIAVNKCFGGFGLSQKARDLYESISGKHIEEYDWCEDMRDDETLIGVIEQLGADADGTFSEIEIVKIPDNNYWVIDNYDGVETVYYSESEIKAK